MKTLLTLLACATLVVHLACTSNDSKQDVNADGEAIESTDDANAALAEAEAGSPAATVAEGTNDGFLDEQLPEDALGETKSAAKTETPDPMAETQPPPTLIEEPAPEATVADSSIPSPNESVPEMPTTTEPTVQDTTASVDVGGVASTSENTGSAATSSESSTAYMGTGSTESTESKPKASLKKVEAVPFVKEGVLLNAVYIARPKDSYKSISKMIYGSEDKAKELKKVNPTMSTPKAGNKIYYNSPARPTDDQKILPYYADAGMSPEVYVAKEGDDLKKVSKKLLGYDKAWMEIWALNDVESKGRLVAGTELKYWKAAPIAAPPMMNDVAPPIADMPPPEPQMEAPPAMPPPEMPAAAPVATNDMPPPMPETPPPPQAEAQPDLPPPPPPVEMTPPPPPMAKAPKAEVHPDAGMDNDLMMSLAGAGILAAGFAAIIIMRKRKQQKEMSSAFNDTQVGT